MVACSHYFISVTYRVITDYGGGIGGFTLYLYVILSTRHKGFACSGIAIIVMKQMM